MPLRPTACKEGLDSADIFCTNSVSHTFVCAYSVGTHAQRQQQQESKSRARQIRFLDGAIIRCSQGVRNVRYNIALKRWRGAQDECALPDDAHCVLAGCDATHVNVLAQQQGSVLGADRAYFRDELLRRGPRSRAVGPCRHVILFQGLCARFCSCLNDFEFQGHTHKFQDRQKPDCPARMLVAKAFE